VNLEPSFLVKPMLSDLASDRAETRETRKRVHLVGLKRDSERLGLRLGEYPGSLPVTQSLQVSESASLRA
jgi:hypothetical protein